MRLRIAVRSTLDGKVFARMKSPHSSEIGAWSGGICLLLALATLSHGAEQAGLLLLGGGILLLAWAALLGRAGS
jgi:membrane-bound ClpP family serine protease